MVLLRSWRLLVGSGWRGTTFKGHLQLPEWFGLARAAAAAARHNRLQGVSRRARSNLTLASVQQAQHTINRRGVCVRMSELVISHRLDWLQKRAINECAATHKWRGGKLPRRHSLLAMTRRPLLMARLSKQCWCVCVCVRCQCVRVSH